MSRGLAPLPGATLERWRRLCARLDGGWPGLYTCVVTRRLDAVFTVGLDADIAVLNHDDLLAFTASLLGVLLGLGLGVSGYGTGTGLEGYDLVLTAIAVGGGVFCQRDGKALAIAAVATGVTFFVHGALQVFLAPMGWPSLTLGFCITTVPILLLREPATARPGAVLQFMHPESSSSLALCRHGQISPQLQTLPAPYLVSVL